VTLLTHNPLEDKLSLVLVPLLAAAGLRVLKLIWNDESSGRALFDALHASPGITLPSNPEEIERILLRTNGAYAIFPKFSSLKNTAPNDFALVKTDRFKQKCLFTLYGFAWDGIACDIRIGDYSGAIPFDIGAELASEIKKHCDTASIASSFFITNMIQPLGQALGPHFELKEAFCVLESKGPLDLMKLAIELGADLLIHTKKFTVRTHAKSFLKKQLQTGTALDKFKNIIQMMNGNLGPKDVFSPPVHSQKRIRIVAPRRGYVQRIAMDRLMDVKHRLCSELRAAGLLLLKKIGDRVAESETLAEAFIPLSWDAQILQNELRDIFWISSSPPEFRPLIVEKIKGGFRF